MPIVHIAECSQSEMDGSENQVPNRADRAGKITQVVAAEMADFGDLDDDEFDDFDERQADQHLGVDQTVILLKRLAQLFQCLGTLLLEQCG